MILEFKKKNPYFDPIKMADPYFDPLQKKSPYFAALAALALRKALKSWFLPSFAQSAKPLQSINWLFD